MSDTLFFYDLETSGIYPDSGRIMQFAGQRTDAELNPIGEPINRLIRLTPDTLPDPGAVLVHGITPQQTVLEGISEAEFMVEFYDLVATPGTTFVGFNNIRFDDEFIRYLNYRNLYDPYSWSYEHGNSRWDILDVVRLTRALRPEGIKWPTDAKGANVNRLELLTKENGLKHESAHDALSDVFATIAVAKLIKEKQPKLYDYLYKLRVKSEAAKLVNSNRPFVYTSSHYPSSQLHTTVVSKVGDHPDANCVMVFDLRYDPEPWLNKSAEQLADAWRFVKDRNEDDPPLPVKTMRINRCPAIAPLGVVKDEQTLDRLALSFDSIEKHYDLLRAHSSFAQELELAVEILNQEQEQRQKGTYRSVDAMLYSGFFNDKDRALIKEFHQEENPDKIREYKDKFSDKRLKQLSGLYLSRNFDRYLTEEERKVWDDYIEKRLFSGGENSRLASYFKRIEQLVRERTDSRSLSLLEDLKLYGESMIPSDLD